MPRSNKNLVLAAMVLAVAMTFIDQTIVAIAVPDLQNECHAVNLFTAITRTGVVFLWPVRVPAADGRLQITPLAADTTPRVRGAGTHLDRHRFALAVSAAR